MYIAAFAPDKGESMSTLIKRIPRLARRCPRSCRRRTAICSSTRRSSAASFAGDVKPETAAFMADSQVPWGVDALGGDDQRAGMEDEAELVSGLTTDDQMIPPAAQRVDVQARRRDSRRGRRQSCDLRVAAASGREPDREGRQRRAGDGSTLAGGVRRILSNVDVVRRIKSRRRNIHLKRDTFKEGIQCSRTADAEQLP